MENINDFEIVNIKGKLSITYIGKTPNIDKCSNELDSRFATFHLVKSLLSALAENTPTSSEQLATPDVVQRTCSICLFCQINPSSEDINDKHKCLLHERPMLISDNTTHTCDDWTELPF